MKRFTLVLLVMVCVASCRPSVEISGSWKNTKASPVSVHKILVTALSNSPAVRETIENDLSAAFHENGYPAVKSIDILPSTFATDSLPDKERLLGAIRTTAVEAILTVSVLNQDDENRYVPGTSGYEPAPTFGHYERFWGYYSTLYPSVYSPGYYAPDKIYFLEINLYDVKTEELLWSAQSESYNPETLPSFSQGLATVILDRLEEDHVIKRPRP